MRHRYYEEMIRLAVSVIMPFCVSPAWAADPPCDKYPPAKQSRCTKIWEGLNNEDGPAIAQFGLDQQKRRDAGTITPEQHLTENMQFIKRSTQRRLERLRERMAKE